MGIKKLVKKTANKIFQSAPEKSKKKGVDRTTAKPRISRKEFDEIAEITFKKHEKSFEKLAE